MATETVETVDQVAHRIATELELPAQQRSQDGLLRWCRKRLDRWVGERGSEIRTLDELGRLVGDKLGLAIDEVRHDDDFHRIEREHGGGRDLAVAMVRAELDDQTDGLLLKRQRREEWERPFLAVVDGRGGKERRVYFSRWHETAHLLTANRQLQFGFQFRRTPVERKDPEEILMDKIAGELAFYAPLVEPVLADLTRDRGRLDFDAVENMRLLLAPRASLHASLIGSVNNTSLPAILVRAKYGYKVAEERIVRDAERRGRQAPSGLVQKLRAVDVTQNDAARDAGVRVHRNMEVPATSVVARALLASPVAGSENLGTWRTSEGPLAARRVYVDARCIDDSVFALITVL